MAGSIMFVVNHGISGVYTGHPSGFWFYLARWHSSAGALSYAVPDDRAYAAANAWHGANDYSGHGSHDIMSEVLNAQTMKKMRQKPVEHVHGAVQFDHVSFGYAEDRPLAVNDFSLDVKPGECIAFVGESGSGKTTLMNLLIGFWRPQKGNIYLDGIAQSELDVRSWRQHIAVVPQHTILFSGSLRDNVRYGREDIDDATIEAAIDSANLREMVNEMPEGLDTKVGENGMQLSGGQRQRVAIARAIVRDPQIIILDEATSALDVASEREVQIAIDHLINQRTTFIVAHRLSTIRHANRIVVMRDGVCREMGSREHLLAKPESEFSRLESLQYA